MSDYNAIADITGDARSRMGKSHAASGLREASASFAAGSAARPGQVLARGGASAEVGATSIYDRLIGLISIEPDRTETELADRLFGQPGCRTRISFSCQLLLCRGLVVRGGSGGLRDPFRYRAVVSAEDPARG